jgi:hypothetical protein
LCSLAPHSLCREVFEDDSATILLGQFVTTAAIFGAAAHPKLFARISTREH